MYFAQYNYRPPCYMYMCQDWNYDRQLIIVNFLFIMSDLGH